MTRSIAVFLASLLLATGAAAADDSPHQTIRIGGDVHVTEAASGPLTAIGGRVVVDAPVAGQLRAAGGHIIIDSDAAIQGGAKIAGGSITVKGPIQGDLRAAGGQITLDGPVTGDASIAGGALTLGPNARISGKLQFEGGDLKQDPAAQVTGGIERAHSHWRHQQEPTAYNRITRGWAWTLGLIVMAALFAGVMPGPSQRLAQELRERPWISALLGLLAITAIPMAAILLIVTIIGIPIAVLGLLLYAVLLLAGYVWLAVVLGGLILDRVNAQTATLIGWRIGAAALAMLAIALLVRMPYVGGALKFTALIVGVGMIVGAVFRSRQARATVTPA